MWILAFYFIWGRGFRGEGAWSKYKKLFAPYFSTILANFHQNRFRNVDFSIQPYGSRGAGAWSKYEKLIAPYFSTIRAKFHQNRFINVDFRI